jgi:hypothetical protein
LTGFTLRLPVSKAFSSEMAPVRVEKTRPTKNFEHFRVSKERENALCLASHFTTESNAMRAEAVSLVEQIKQSVGLLRRHL